MLKRLRKAHPILFCVLAEVVFLASLFVTDLVFTIALVLFRADFASIDTYLYSTLQELVGAMVAVLFLVRTDRAGLLRRRGSGFFNGLLVGMYPLVFIGYNAFGSLVLGRPENGVLQPAARIGTFLVSMAMVGVAEEFIFRGVIAQTLLERYKVEAPEGTPGWQLLEMAARKRGYLISGGEVNTERMAKVLLDEFRSGKLGNFTLEMPEDMV